MQVSSHGQIDDHIIIGGGVAQACSIDDTAEFLDMLSDTIYREKALAAVREPICNGWDEHIKLGKTDIPLVINLKDGVLTIRDFGRGIAPDQMHPTYCIYGRSTKRTDEAQTGGFGIGSKAPWAYSKHFNVTSMHNGHRTLYAMSKGSIESGGKPDVRPITTVSTDESGLIVSIPVKEGDEQKILGHVRDVVVGGGIRATLNGELLPFRDYDAYRKQGFVLVPNIYGASNNLRILVGSVLYPLTTDDAEMSNKIGALARLVPPDHRMIVIAKGHTVSIAPSRESLSYNQHTMDSVNALLDRVIARMVKIGEDRYGAKTVLRVSWHAAWNGMRHKTVDPSTLISQASRVSNVVADPRDIAILMAAKRVGSETHINRLSETDRKVVFDQLRRTDRSRAPLWKSLFANPTYPLLLKEKLFRTTLRQMAQRALRAGLLESLSMYQSRSYSRAEQWMKPGRPIKDVTTFADDYYREVEGDEYSDYTRGPAIILAATRAGFRSGLSSLSSSMSSDEAMPVLMVSKDQKAEARAFGKFMKKLGFRVIDQLDHVVIRERREKPVKPAVAELFFATGNGGDAPEGRFEGVPKHFIHIAKQASHTMDESWRSTYRVCMLLAKLLPDTCIVYTKEGVDEAVKLGAKSAIKAGLALVGKAVAKDGNAILYHLIKQSELFRAKTGNSYYDPQRNFAGFANQISKKHPGVAHVITGRRRVTFTETDKVIAALIDQFRKISNDRNFNFRSREEGMRDAVNNWSIDNLHTLMRSKHIFAVDDLIKARPELGLLGVESCHAMLTEESVLRLIRAIMRA